MKQSTKQKRLFISKIVCRRLGRVSEQTKKMSSAFHELTIAHESNDCFEALTTEYKIPAARNDLLQGVENRC